MTEDVNVTDVPNMGSASRARMLRYFRESVTNANYVAERPLPSALNTSLISLHVDLWSCIGLAESQTTYSTSAYDFNG